MKQLGILGVAVALVLGVVLTAFHPAFAGTTKIKKTGTVTAVSSTSISVLVPATSTVAASTTKFAVGTKTKVYGKNESRESIGVVSVGDAVVVEGTQVVTTVPDVTPATTVTTNTATKITDKSIWRAKVSGVIADLDATAKTFHLVISKKVPELNVNATYNQDNIGNGLTKIQQTTITKTATTRTTVLATMAWTDLANGQAVTTNGLWNSVKKSVIDSYIVMPTITIKK